MRLSRLTAALITSLSLANIANAGTFTDQFFDKDDGWLDGSDWVLNNAVGFMPIPILITEPAVGEGIGLAAAFFHPPKGYSDKEFTDKRARAAAAGKREELVLPNISVIAAAVTNNGSWLVGGGHIAHWKDDSIRFEPMAGYASINITYYFPNDPGGLIPEGEGLEFNGEGSLASLPIAFRLGGSNFFLGTVYDFAKVTTKFDNEFPFLEVLNFETTQSGLGLFLQYDSRNTPFSPSLGTLAKVTYKRDSETIGSDWNFDRVTAFVNQYWNVTPKWVLGVRASTEYVDGELPFFAAPYIDMRGIPAMRYQGEAVALAETELRWSFHPRISVLGFIGAGKSADSYGDMSDTPSRVSKGMGLRYLLAKKLGMQGGIDVAKGPEDTYFYLTIGSAWGK